MFDDALLDDPTALEASGERLRWLALSGARLRSQSLEDMAAVTAKLARMGAARPRSVVVAGAGSAVVRALVQPESAVPVVAWSSPRTPAWTGPLDLLIVLAGADGRWQGFCRDGARRGAMVLVVAPPRSPLLDGPGSAVLLPAGADDPLAAAWMAVAVLGGLGLGEAVDLTVVADRLDLVSEQDGPRHQLGSNPAKDLACALADAVPLVYGGSPLAAQVAAQVAAALRQATGLPGLSGDAATLEPLLRRSRFRDVFADPFEAQTGLPGYVVLIVDDGQPDPAARDLAGLAAARYWRVERIQLDQGGPVERFAGLCQHGLLAAAYLGLAWLEGS